MDLNRHSPKQTLDNCYTGEFMNMFVAYMLAPESNDLEVPKLNTKPRREILK
jgi:hypothetical protein